MTTSIDPVTKFLSRFSLRDAGHFIAGYVATLLPTINFTGVHVSKAALLALIPGATAVLFRQLFPHVTITASEANTVVSDVEHVLAKLKVSSPVITTGLADTGFSFATATRSPQAMNTVNPPVPATPTVTQ